MSADTPATKAAPSGVIHDIGYRHYDGPRLGRSHARATLFLDGLKGAFGFGRSTRAKVAPLILLAAACIPALIQTVIMVFVGNDQFTGGYLEYSEYIQVLVFIFVAVLAPGLMSRDLRSNVLVLYFSRPLHRIDYVGAKLGAAITALLIFMLVPLTLLLVGALLADISLGSQLPDFLRAVVASTMLAVMLASIGLLVAALAPRRGMGTAAIMTVLLVSSAAGAILMEIGDEAGSETLETYATLLSPYTIIDRISSSILGATPNASTLEGTLPLLVYFAASIALVAACVALLMLRYRRVSVS